MSKETGGPAFPLAYEGWDNKEVHGVSSMTLRDYFAAKVMAALVPLPSATLMDDIARDAYKQADWMLVERAK